MALAAKAKYVDRDDFDGDHYADFIRDTHRSKLTLEQLDISRRQLRCKENLLSRTLQLKLKEHVRIKNEFIRKVEQDPRISRIPAVRQTLKEQQRRRIETSTPSTVPDQSMKFSNQVLDSQETVKPIVKQSKRVVEWKSPKAIRTEANLNLFNNKRSLLN